ncbi:MAG: radical SAM protein [Desulfurococcales archaeon]|nr:radical SAM protein [Desulfurococcales archaeon]
MIPLSVMVTGKGTVSTRIKGRYHRGRPSRFTSIIRPVVFWNITYKCNLRCQHCYINAGPDVSLPELSLSQTLDVARQIVEHGIPLVVFTGGEPLVSEKFWKTLEYFHEIGKPKTSVSTNGTLIDHRNAKRLKKLGITYVGISLDSLDPEKHDKFRGAKGAWKAAVNGMKNSVAAGLPTGLRVTVTTGNIEEVPSMIDFSADLGLQRVSIYLLDTVGRGAKIISHVPRGEMLRELIDELVEKAREYDGVLEILLVRMNFAGIYLADKLSSHRQEFYEYLELLGSQGDCGRKTASIYPDGTVRPCQFIDYVIVGDLRRQSLQEILSPDNPRLKPFIDTASRLRGTKCRSCPFKDVCGGGSRNRALTATGDFWGDDPACFINPAEIAERWKS